MCQSGLHYENYNLGNLTIERKVYAAFMDLEVTYDKSRLGSSLGCVESI